MTTNTHLLPTPADDLYARLESLSKSLEGSGRLDEHDNPDAYATVLDAMSFVRSALAAPQPEPVATVVSWTNGSYWRNYQLDWHKDVEAGAKLYDTPPAAPAPAVPADAALNTLAKLFHNGEEIEGDDGAAMMVDMVLWNEACEAFESLIGEGDSETLAQSAAPAVREPSTYRQIAEATGQWADVPSDKVIGIWRAAEQAHGIGGGGK